MPSAAMLDGHNCQDISIQSSTRCVSKAERSAPDMPVLACVLHVAMLQARM